MSLPEEYYTAKTNIDNLLKNIETASFQLEADKQAALKDALSKFMEQFVTPSWNRSTIGRNPVIYAGAQLPSAEYTLKATYSGALVDLTDPATDVVHPLPWVKQFEWEHPELIDYNFVLDSIFKNSWITSKTLLEGIPADYEKDGLYFYMPTVAYLNTESMTFESVEEEPKGMPLDNKTIFPSEVTGQPSNIEWGQFVFYTKIWLFSNSHVKAIYKGDPWRADAQWDEYTVEVRQPMVMMVLSIPQNVLVQILGQTFIARSEYFFDVYAASLSPTQVGTFNYVGEWQITA